jgi:hypothetical protein
MHRARVLSYMLVFEHTYEMAHLQPYAAGREIAFAARISQPALHAQHTCQTPSKSSSYIQSVYRRSKKQYEQDYLVARCYRPPRRDSKVPGNWGGNIVEVMLEDCSTTLAYHPVQVQQESVDPTGGLVIVQETVRTPPPKSQA